MNNDLNTVIKLIRDFHGISKSISIDADTKLEKELGITGDDGVELIEFIQDEMKLSFVGADGSLREAFDLDEDEYLFNGEGFSLNFFTKKEKIKDTKVKDIVLAINRVDKNNGN